jgi:hypothetical protein
MRKQLLTALIALSAGVLSAQTCNPQYQDSTFGAWPDTTTNFETAYVAVPYVQPLDFKAPSDAGDINPTYAGAAISSYKVTSVTGLPSGFTYQCSAANCEYAGGTAGCAELTGTATSAQVGTHPIEINIQATIMAGPVPVPVTHTFNGYKLIVEEQGTTGLSMVSPDQVYVYPNPASSVINVVNATNFTSMEVYSVNGQLVLTKAVSKTDESINISELKEGIYFLHMVSGTSKSVHKFTKK